MCNDVKQSGGGGGGGGIRSFRRVVMMGPWWRGQGVSFQHFLVETTVIVLLYNYYIMRINTIGCTQ